jgi:hypothetical protein
MKKSSIYPNRSQELLTLFEKAGNPSKLMCVPIDYAKKDHLVMFCNGNGEVLRKPFSVKNSVDGVKYLIDQVNRSCRHRHIQYDHVFFGGEDVNSYAENFANSIRANGWLVANVNAHDAKKQRENLQASTDRSGSDGYCHHAAQPPGQLLPGTDRRVSQPANPGAPSKEAGQDENRSPQPDPYDCRPPLSWLSE